MREKRKRELILKWFRSLSQSSQENDEKNIMKYVTAALIYVPPK
jgi:hypothetical protein